MSRHRADMSRRAAGFIVGGFILAVLGVVAIAVLAMSFAVNEGAGLR